MDVSDYTGLYWTDSNQNLVCTLNSKYHLNALNSFGEETRGRKTLYSFRKFSIPPTYQKAEDQDIKHNFSFYLWVRKVISYYEGRSWKQD